LRHSILQYRWHHARFLCRKLCFSLAKSKKNSCNYSCSYVLINYTTDTQVNVCGAAIIKCDSSPSSVHLTNKHLVHTLRRIGVKRRKTLFYPASQHLGEIIKVGGHMGIWGRAPMGVQGQSSWWEVRGRSPLKLKTL